MAGPLRTFLALGSRAAAGQAIVLLALPLLSRLYGPDAFGIYGTVIAVTGIAIIAGTASLDLAIMEARSPRQVQDLLVLAGATGVVATLLAALGAAGYFSVLEAAEGPGALAGALWVLAITIPGISFHVAVATRLVTQGPGAAGRAHVVRGLVMVAVASVGYVLFDSAAGLLLGHALGFAAVARPAETLRGGRRMAATLSQRIHRGWTQARGYVRFMMPQSVLSSGSQQGAVLLVGVLSGVHWAGIYWLAFRAVGVPNTLIGKPLRQVSLRSLSRMTSTTERARFVARASALIALCYLPIPLLLWFGGEWAFGLAFGAEWRAAAPIGFWLSCWLGLGLVNAPAHMMLVHADRKVHLLGLELVGSVLRLTALTWGLLQYDVVTATAAFALAGIAGNLFMIAWGITVSRSPTAIAE